MPRCVSGLLIVIIWDEDDDKGTRLNLLNERVGSLPPYLCRSNHRVDGHPQPLLRTIRCIVNITARGMPDHEDIQIAWRWPMPLQVARRPGTEDQNPLRTIQPGEFLSYHLQRPPREEQQFSQGLDKTIANIRPDHGRSPDVATTQQAGISEALHLSMHRAERSIEPPRKIREAVLSFGVEQEGGKDVSLQLRSEHGQKRGRLASHNLNISTI